MGKDLVGVMQHVAGKLLKVALDREVKCDCVMWTSRKTDKKTTKTGEVGWKNKNSIFVASKTYECDLKISRSCRKMTSFGNFGLKLIFFYSDRRSCVMFV